MAVREVFENNIHQEFNLIELALQQDYTFAALDVEFPRIVYQLEEPYFLLDINEKYTHMKKNVNACKITQLGLTLSDAYGNSRVWQFNFGGFDVEVDAWNPSSVELLKRQGIDFDRNRMEGVSVSHFAKLFRESRLGSSALGGREWGGITWVLFHSTFDLGYLIKVLLQKDLPDDRMSFILLVYCNLGFSIFDVKEIGKPLGFYGGLEKVAQELGVSRQVGKAHQAGSDSLLTMQAFLKLREKYFSGRNSYLMEKFNHKLYGLEESPADPSEVLQVLWRLMIIGVGGDNEEVEYEFQEKESEFQGDDEVPHTVLVPGFCWTPYGVALPNSCYSCHYRSHCHQWSFGYLKI